MAKINIATLLGTHPDYLDPSRRASVEWFQKSWFVSASYVLTLCTSAGVGIALKERIQIHPAVLLLTFCAAIAFLWVFTQYVVRPSSEPGATWREPSRTEKRIAIFAFCLGILYVGIPWTYGVWPDRFISKQLDFFRSGL